MEKNKSRDLPISDFYTLLQLEYISYKVREFLYERPQDKKKFNDISTKKRENIESMSFRQCSSSIFNNISMQKKYLDKFLNEFGVPNFCYRDEYQKKVKGLWDCKFFFQKGIKGKIKKIDGTIMEVVFLGYDDSDDTVKINDGVNKFKVPANTVSRDIKEILNKIF